MTAISPTMSVKSREMIGGEQFSQRREVFDQHATVFLPPASPTAAAPAPAVERIVTSNHGKTTANFKRNTPGYSSMRESRTDYEYDFRPRKYSDNFTSELNQSDDVDYRRSMTERTRRLSKMRRDFLTSNLHEPCASPFARAGTRASLPAKSLSPNSPVLKYKIESPNLYKFPFAEPYKTPTPTRKVFLDLGSAEVDSAGGKENEDPEKTKYESLPNNNTSKIDHQKLFEELVKRYSPQRKPIDWKLPPTKPRVIASVPKSSTDSIDSNEKKHEDKIDKTDEEVVFEMTENNLTDSMKRDKSENTQLQNVVRNGPDTLDKKGVSKTSLSELEEKNDQVPELGNFQRQLSKESAKKQPINSGHPDLTIPALIQKMTTEGDDLENHSKETKKVKRKRSFLDKLLGRKKDK